MGNANSHTPPSASKAPSSSSPPPVCIECDISKKRDLPSTDDISSTPSSPCAALYDAVDRCMKLNKGKIAPCAQQWSDFNQCHEQESRNKRPLNQTAWKLCCYLVSAFLKISAGSIIGFVAGRKECNWSAYSHCPTPNPLIVWEFNFWKKTVWSMNTGPNPTSHENKTRCQAFQPRTIQLLSRSASKWHRWNTWWIVVRAFHGQKTVSRISIRQQGRGSRNLPMQRKCKINQAPSNNIDTTFFVTDSK
jgi:hypothetical protein